MKPEFFMIVFSSVMLLMLITGRSRKQPQKKLQKKHLSRWLLVFIAAIAIASLPIWLGAHRAIAQIPNSVIDEVLVDETLPDEILPSETLPDQTLPTNPVTPSFDPPKQKGIAYVDWSTNGYTSYSAEQSLQQLRSTGADWISLLVTQYQNTIASTDIYSNGQTPSDASLIAAINQAHNLGLKVMLKPHLDLFNDPQHWRGQIGRNFTDAQWDTWFSNYQTMISRYAQLAQATGAEQFAVGIELQATEGQADRWRAVIAHVRNLYSGPIIYAANHDNTELSWWDAVDYIGVDAYYTLTDKTDPTVDELKAAWQPYVASLADLAARWNKPVLFPEIGFRSQDGANRASWEWQLNGRIDLQEQADCYQALFESFFHQPWFAGIYIWSWATWPEGGPHDQGYTPRGKPAEAVLRWWYGGNWPS
jgi:hypothetical protein